MAADTALRLQEVENGPMECGGVTKLATAISRSDATRATLKFCRKTSLPASKLRYSKNMKNTATVYEEEEENVITNGVDACFECSLRSSRTGSIKSQKEAVLPIPRDGSKRNSSFMDLSNIDSAEMEAIGASVLGTTSSSNTYIGYMQKVLNIPDKRMTILCEQAQKKENPELKLACTVKSATHLLMKDLKSALPDVVCHLAVVSREKQSDSSFCSHDTLEWRRQGLIREVKLTKFAPATLSPVWKESFHLRMNDPAEDMVVVEVWGRKNKDRKVPPTKKPKEYYKKPENFIGRAFYVLKTTPLEGEERTLTLYSHSAKHERGKVTLQLSIKGQRENVPIDVSIREHTILQKLIVNHESQDKGTPITLWDAKLGAEAEIILLKHVELTGITTLQENSIRLSALLDYHKFNGVKLRTFAGLVEEIVKHELLTQKGNSNEHVWVKQLLIDMKSLHAQMLEVVRGHLVKYNIKASADIEEIEACVRILKALHSFPPILSKLKEDHRNLKTTLEICIQVAVPVWFLELSKSLLSDRGLSSADGELELMALKGLCIHCLRHSLRAYKTLNPIFQSVGINYFTEFYVALDKLLCGEAMPRIRHFISELKEPIVYELYVVIKDLAKLSDHVIGLHHENLEILGFHKSFVGLPIFWIELATTKCKQRVEKAISLDEKTVTGLDQARYSSSAIDTEGFLLQLGLFWKNLEWPIATDAIGYLGTIIEHISQLSLFYVDTLYKKLLLDYAIMYDEKGRFQSSERLCTILNNMYHVKKTLSEMPVTLDLDIYYEWLNDNCKQLGDKAKKLVDTLLSSNDEDIDNKLSYFVDRITERLTPDISCYFEVMLPVARGNSSGRHLGSITRADGTAQGIHWPWNNKDTEEHLSNEEAITPLLNYLTANLQILGDYLLTPVLNGILYKLWNMVIGVVQGRMIVIPRKESTMYLFERLEYFMRELKSFFHAEGNGMNLPNLETETYRFIINKLQLLQTDSKELLGRYLLELSEQQKYLDNYTSNKGGSLQISVGYLIDKAVVEISVIQARNLPGNTQLNTYVEVHLLPNWIFKKVKKARRTPVSKGTTNPYYGEEFQIRAKEEDVVNMSSVLLLVVCDEDSGATLGISAVQGLEIPHLFSHIQSLSQENVPERRKMTLTIFTQKESTVLKEIESRIEANDQEVIDFYKTNKRVFEQCQFRKSTLTKWLGH